MNNKTIIDLSQCITPGMSLFPGTEAPVFQKIANQKEHGYLEHRVAFHSHTGTHIDAPAHILAKGKKLTDFPLESFIGKGVCIKVPDVEIIDNKFIVSHKRKLSEVDFALFFTGKGKQWGSESYFKNYPVFSEHAAQILGTFNLKGIGIDTCSPDPIDSTDLPAHKTLLKYNILIIENLASMDILVEKEFVFQTIPLKTVLPDGAPVRAFAIIS